MNITSITPSVILEIAHNIETHPAGFENLTLEDKVFLKNLFKNYKIHGSYHINYSVHEIPKDLPEIVRRIQSTDTVKKIMNDREKIIETSTNKKIFKALKTAKTLALAAQANNKENGTISEGSSSRNPENLSKPPVDLPENSQENIKTQERFKYVQGRLLNFEKTLKVTDVDKELLMLRCKQQILDFAHRAINIGKEFYFIDKDHSTQTTIPKNPYESGIMYRDLLGYSNMSSNPHECKEKLEKAYGDLCLSLCSIFELPPLTNKRADARQNLADIRWIAIGIIEEFNLGQMLYDLVYVPTYKIENGDTWASIAEMFNTPIRSLKFDNNESSENPPIGKTIRINKNFNKYCIQSNDTWESIAKMCETTEEALKKFNGLSEKSPLPQGGYLQIPPPNFK